jgi:hypothetical protein
MEEITRLRSEVQERQERIDELRKLRSHPTVIPVRVFYRHGSRYEEPDEWAARGWDALRTAHAANWALVEEGHGSPVGVSVGGFLIDDGDLDERYPDVKGY